MREVHGRNRCLIYDASASFLPSLDCYSVLPLGPKCSKSFDDPVKERLCFLQGGGVVKLPPAIGWQMGVKGVPWSRTAYVALGADAEGDVATVVDAPVTNLCGVVITLCVWGRHRYYQKLNTSSFLKESCRWLSGISASSNPKAKLGGCFSLRTLWVTSSPTRLK